METWHLPLSHLKSRGETTSHQSPLEQYKEVAYLPLIDINRARNSFSKGFPASSLDYTDSLEYLAFEHSWDKAHTPYLRLDSSKDLITVPNSLGNTLWAQDFVEEIRNTTYSEIECGDKSAEEKEEFREEWSNEYFTNLANQRRQTNLSEPKNTSYPETMNDALFGFWDSLEYQGHTSRSAWSWEAVFTNRVPSSELSSEELIKTAHSRIDLLLNHLMVDQAES